MTASTCVTGPQIFRGIDIGLMLIYEGVSVGLRRSDRMVLVILCLRMVESRDGNNSRALIWRVVRILGINQ